MRTHFSLEVTFISCYFHHGNIVKPLKISIPLLLLLCAAQGRGAKGQNDYEFSLAFLLPVKPEVFIHISVYQNVFFYCFFYWLPFNFADEVSYKSTQRQVNVTVRKEQRGWWERLIVQERKPVFLAPDFDRWLDESDAEMEIREKVRLNLCCSIQIVKKQIIPGL